MKIEIIKVKHQTFSLIVWLEFPSLKFLKDFERSFKKFKGL